MSGIKRILVHIDHESDSTLALQKTVQLALLSNASVELFCSAYNRALHQSHLFDKKAEQHAEHGYVKSVESKLEIYARQLEAKGISCGVDVYWERHCIDGLIRKALRDEPDVVIYPLRRHAKLGDIISGDTEKKLVRECPVPVLLTRGVEWTVPVRAAACIDPFHPIDKPEQLDHTVLDMTVAICKQFEIEMDVVHSFHTLPHAVIFDEHVVTDYDALKSKVRGEHRAALTKLLSPYNLVLDDPRVRILEGETHKVLPAYVRDAGIDLLVMGQVAKGFLDRVFSGSTVERILNDLECDLLVVKSPGFVSPVSV